MSFIEFQWKIQQMFFSISAEKFKLTLHYVKVAVNISYAFAHKQFYIINSCSGYFAPAYFMKNNNKNKNYSRISCIQRRHWVSLWNFCQVDWRFEWLLFFVFKWKFLVICLSFDVFHLCTSERSYRSHSAFDFNTLFDICYVRWRKLQTQLVFSFQSNGETF